ncbi:hypothetical protein LEP1GSC050_2392 [Leptospira broomii serovar Hurstbridge str. 5399]|uniref:Uncharacterized protein n=1 Tax=Leptospira broomii serovar Hurstbridge str. 5399 TaxID=1049789 RepID=T0EZC8_9LEPT|nr:hypothetical protein [Leptospira broomii]EQA44235.1 hypothetical protein LEP1GSC050_2392 [Leptospira broomii serovar Hurstbridge str. 5399]
MKKFFILLFALYIPVFLMNAKFNRNLNVLINEKNQTVASIPEKSFESNLSAFPKVGFGSEVFLSDKPQLIFLSTAFCNDTLSYELPTIQFQFLDLPPPQS